MSVVQPPVTVAAPILAPDRVSVFKPPYRVINLSVTGTIWIADNPGLRLGLGTPINPGTSLRWTRDGDLWMIADEPTNAIISYDVDDWQPNPAAIAAALLNSGVIIIDNPLVLIDDDSYTSPFGGSSDPFDVSRYQSLTLFARPADISIVTYVILLFYDDNDNPLFSHTVRFAPCLGGSVGAVAAELAFPIYGSRFRLFASTTSAFQIRLVASNRPQEFSQSLILPVSAPDGAAQNNLLHARFNLATGGAYIDFIPPWCGDMEILFRTGSVLGAAAGTPTAIAVDHWNDFPAGWDAIRIAAPVADVFGAGVLNFRIPNNGSVMRLRVFNNTGTNWNGCTLTVLAVTNKW